MARHAKEITGADKLCMAGGVALNCVANGKIVQEKIFSEIWVQPAAGDSGGALGAALAYHYLRGNASPKEEGKCIQKHSCWGPSFSDDEIKAYLDSFGYKYVKLPQAERNKTLAKYLAEGKIAGHFLGGVEYGPRALGSRSILGDPRSESTQSSLNLKIKFRESFRPFAPSVLEEEVPKYFNLHQPSPYMLIVAPVNEDRRIKNTDEYKNNLFEIVNQKRSDLPAITHVDYSARVQSVNKETSPEYYDLINEFKKLTGYGVIINTSFNVNGEPIVCTPKDAVNCFMATHMDLLFMNNFMLLKEEQTNKNGVSGVRKKAEVPLHKLKAMQKAQEDAKSIYNKYFPSLSSFRQEITQRLSGNKQSAWVDFYGGDYFVKGEPVTAVAPADITKHWKSLPAEKRKAFHDFLAAILRLSEKHKLEADDMVHTVSDSIYVMF